MRSNTRPDKGVTTPVYLTREQIEGWMMNNGAMSPNEFRALCNLALCYLAGDVETHKKLLQQCEQLKDRYFGFWENAERRLAQAGRQQKG